MKSHSGNALEEHIKDLAKGFTIWATILLINIDGTFSSKEVALMRHMFDDETANEVEKFYENADANELENYIHDMINQEIKKIEGLPIKDRQDILYNIERISSVCDGEENEIVRQLSFIAKLLDLNSKVQIRSMDFNK